jgi:phenylpropionate dioxygenase-like ring-hydroxylating dioxygenase large terminal subunit
MFDFVFFLSTTVVAVVLPFSFFVLRQYRRVQKRDATRLRIQIHPSTSSPTSLKYDPLDHSLYWYPVAFSHEIFCGSGRPFGFSLLNEPMCLYRRNDGQIICVLDVCPHRSAPLSLGQITKDGNLECVYHGWQFGAHGQCVRIPSVSKTSKTASLICARTVPVHEQYGYIWVWPGQRELANSDLIPHRLFTDLLNENGKFLLSPDSVCGLDIPYELMVDNLLDLAHIDFTHDGMIGKRSEASCIRSERIIPSPYFSTNAESVSFKVQKYEQTPPFPSTEFSHMHFIPPCFVRLDHHGRKNGELIVQIFFIIPTAEKKMRLLMQFHRNFACYKWIEYIPGYDYLADKFVMKIVDQDVLLLNGIQRNIAEMGAKPLGTTVSADAPIKAFRRYQSRALSKFETIYLEKRAWTKLAKINTDEPEEIDIEDLKME